MYLLKKIFWITYDKISNFEWRNKWWHEITKSLEKSGLMIKGVNKTIKNEAKE